MQNVRGYLVVLRRYGESLFKWVGVVAPLLQGLNSLFDQQFMETTPMKATINETEKLGQMPNLYLVKLLAIPSSGSEEFGEVGGAIVDTFVKADSLAEAAQKAIFYVMGRLWLVTEQTSVVLMLPEQIAYLDKPASSAYHRAQREGIYSLFVAWPVNDRDDDLVEIRSILDNDHSSDTPH